MISTSFRKFCGKVAVALLWIGLWAAAAKAVGQPLLLPSPALTLDALIALSSRPAFWFSALASVARIALGFLSGFALGCGAAVLMRLSRAARAFLSPLLSVVKATPVASFIMLALVWIRTSGVPIFATALIVLPVACANLSAGIASTDANLLEMANAFKMRRLSQVAHVYWPSVLPSLRAAVMSGMGMAWKAGIAAEVICIPRDALGSFLYDAKITLDTPSMFATTAVVIALSILLERLAVRLTGGREGRRARVQP